MSAALRPLRGLPLPRLARLAERIFGRGDRAPGWLARKLAREAVDPDLSVLAVETGHPEPVSDDMLLGYVLVGLEPGDPVARSAGIGLVPGARGRGLGRAMVTRAAEVLARAGVAALRVLAEPAGEPFYAALGLRLVERRVTLLSEGTSTRGLDDLLASSPPRAWHPDPDSALEEACAWHPGAWTRTPTHERATLELPRPEGTAWAHVSREGRALLVHRLLLPTLDAPHLVLRQLRAALPRGAPLLLYGCDPVSSITAHALAEGFSPAQRFAAMQLALLDKPRRPDA